MTNLASASELAAAHRRRQLPEGNQRRVQDVRIHDGSLVWTRVDDGRQDRVRVDDVLFTLDLSNSKPGQFGFIICCLAQDLEQQTQPFQLHLLAADAVPDQLLQEYRINDIPLHLRNGDGNEVDVVVSTKSGVGHALVFWQSVLQPLWSLAEEALGTQLQASKVVVTQDSQSVRQFARALQPDQAQAFSEAPSSRTIILLSGDGGVVDLLNGREASSGAPAPLLALFPLGTGNALFHSLHKPLESVPGPSPLVLALRTLFLGVPADLPVFRAAFSPGSRIVSFVESSGQASGADANTHLARQDAAVSSLYGAIVASYGFHASIVYESDTPEHRVHGAKRFGMVAQELLRESHPYRAKLQVRRPSSSSPEPDPRETHAYVLVTMVSNLERTFAISPASRPLDNKLRLVHFGPVGGERTMDVMVKAYDGGKHVGMRWDDGEEVRYEEVEEVTVETLEDDARWRKFCVDGTIVEVPKGGSMSVGKAQKGLFRVLVDSRVQLDG
ncbi:tRNA (Guanine(26)-N(2))-dimethyltransferase, mitochondrial [Tolypocladium paradoxum]|uniref:tRNA (Guanine(26)-N(2))-dimethyltransferase, mitochondrial n=1 Tax=Tolypocladium paradoxum TaxID=94208 RepID=A0A2S4L6H3_9HYPO|nr:tRNA (Guanine(26)-N(2))-dimethyltransferase, mitochondrial [Tolypocladium paradoxum]